VAAFEPGRASHAAAAAVEHLVIEAHLRQLIAIRDDRMFIAGDGMDPKYSATASICSSKALRKGVHQCTYMLAGTPSARWPDRSPVGVELPARAAGPVVGCRRVQRAIQVFRTLAGKLRERADPTAVPIRAQVADSPQPLLAGDQDLQTPFRRRAPPPTINSMSRRRFGAPALRWSQ
jgi:hypothetical protein